MTKILLVSGTALLFVGLVMGVDLEVYANAEIALDAHVAAIQHGMLLMIIGLAWRYAELGKLATACAYLNIAGLYGLWVAFMISAIRGEEFAGASTLTNGLLLLSSVLLIVGMGLFLYGLIRHTADS